ncbi:pentapeptide repeat-containing protein [Nonomuraea sp. NN258]|uniref:pentapeptide repeat-containing protein n=1 Tax=Nonomuraea antri TaxID=2730852 RepID=UPI0015695B0F|nr:pentapeptide repeat-containing protein [Nonomuraea antri]NRQ38171.1 pentapeptide repeat-containing protein [Nonomuraea antri]
MNAPFDPAARSSPAPRIAEPSQEELAGLPVEKRLELLQAQRQRDDQERERRRLNRHQWFNSVGILLGALFTAGSLIVTAVTLRNGQEELRTAREGQITDRYTRAVEQLGSRAAEVRFGAIYALRRIAADSPADRLTVRSVLAAFVRNHDLCTPRPAPQCTASIAELGVVRSIADVPSDVYAALTLASELTARGDPGTDFSQVRFPRAALEGARLSGANLESADLTWAGLREADLGGVNASNACLTYARLSGADLSKANLSLADLSGAELTEVNLAGADLRGADLRGAYGMTPGEIKAVAATDSHTRFGERRTGPQSCGPANKHGGRLDEDPEPLHSG